MPALLENVLGCFGASGILSLILPQTLIVRTSRGAVDILTIFQSHTVVVKMIDLYNYLNNINNYWCYFSNIQKMSSHFLHLTLFGEDEHKLRITFTIYYSEILLIVILSHITSLSVTIISEIMFYMGNFKN